MTKVTKPKKVRLAVILLYVSVVLLFVTFVVGLAQLQMLSHSGPIGQPKREEHPDMRFFTAHSAVAMLVAFMSARLALAITLIEMVRRQRNWARVALLVLLALSVPPSISAVHSLFDNHRIGVFLDLIRVALIIVALILLFQPESSKWFESNSSRSR